MAELHLELARRNARFRAWRACGVPFVGGWRLLPADERHGPRGALDFRCGACNRSEYCATDVDFVRAEGNLISYLVECGCTHLGPLLGEDPPEVRAVAELELLAG